MLHFATRGALCASLAAAIALPLSPASAAQMTTSALSPSARFMAPNVHALRPVDIVRDARSRAAKKNVKKAHFAFPYGLGIDSFGDVFVANFNSSTISAIAPNLKANSNVITQGLTSPISVTVDSMNNVFVGNTGGGGTGNVTKYVNSAPVSTTTTNAGYPFSIAVDQFDDLYIAGSGGIAADDPYGNSIFGPEYGGYNIISIALGNGNVYGFIDGNYLIGNGSVLLRTASLQGIVGPDGAVTPVGASCGSNLCWYSDSTGETLTVNNGSNSFSTALGYDPGGVVADPLRNRVFVADPLNNAVHVYNATTLAPEKTII